MNAPTVDGFDDATFDQLMNKHRDFEGCLDMILNYLINKGPNIDTNFYKKAVQSVLMCRKISDSQTVELLAQARSQSDWTETDEGDLLREVAINLIRQGEYDKARECVDLAYSKHMSDLNRVACLMGIYARIQAETGDLENSLLSFEGASKIWIKSGVEANPIWVNNARTHWLIAMVKSGVGRFDKQRRHIWWRITLEEKNWKKRAAATLLQVGNRKVIGFVERHA